MRDIIKNVPYKWIALIIASFGSFNVALDVYIINISRPMFRDAFELSYEAVLWVYLVYPLLGSSLFLTWGRLGDIKGRERVFILGFLFYTIGLALCPIVDNFVALIVFRIIQVIGLTMIHSLAPAIAIGNFPDRERGKSLGMYLALFASGAVIGSFLGGFLIDHFSWQAIFYLRLPLAVTGLIMAFTMLRRAPPADAGGGFDFRGAVILLVCLSCFILAINQGREQGWTSPIILGTGIASLILAPVLLIVEKRAVQPVLDLMLFRNRMFTLAILGMGLALTGVVVLDVLTPFYVIEGAGYSKTEMGIVMMSYVGIMTAMHPLAGWFGSRVGVPIICTLGLVLGGITLFWVSGLGADASLSGIITRVMVYGFAVGLFFTPFSSAIMGSVPEDKLGTASAMLATARQVATVIGSAIFMTLFHSRKLVHVAQLTSEGVGEEAAESLGVVGGFHDTVLLAVGITILGLMVTLLMHKRSSR
ncbi:MFS transporter [Chloroflexota bacterium]